MLQMAKRVLVFLRIANWVVGVAIIGILVFAGFVANERIMAAIATNPDGIDPASMITFVRLSLLFMPLAVGLSHVIFKSLLEMIDSIPSDQVFTYSNSDRLRRIACALLGFCVIDLVYGLLSMHYVDRIAHWTPTLTGWLSSLMLFVLASVWKQGVTMREELEGTV